MSFLKTVKPHCIPLALPQVHGAWRVLRKRSGVRHQSPRSFLFSRNYSDKPTVAEISQKANTLVDKILADNGAAEIVKNPIVQTHLVVARAKGLNTFENKLIQSSGLITSAIFNALLSSSLHWFFERYNFYTHDESKSFDEPYFLYDKKNTQYVKTN